jgi:hypothetical protein
LITERGEYDSTRRQIIFALQLARPKNWLLLRRFLALAIHRFAVSLAIDFATGGSTRVPLLAALTDDEVDAALEESEYCARLLRRRDRTRLVDCSTGTLTVIR